MFKTGGESPTMRVICLKVHDEGIGNIRLVCIESFKCFVITCCRGLPSLFLRVRYTAGTTIFFKKGVSGPINPYNYRRIPTFLMFFSQISVPGGDSSILRNLKKDRAF